MSRKSKSPKKESASKSNHTNDLIRQTKEQPVQFDWIKTKIGKAEKSGFNTDSKEQILNQAKSG